MLKVTLIGYGELAQGVLLGILNSKHQPVGVLRWKKHFLKDLFLPDTLTSIMRANNIPDIKAKRVNTKAFKREMKRLQPDVVVVAAWGEIIRREIIDLPRVAFVNCHPSLLPAHRGSNPYVSVIREGENRTGVTFHLMSEKIDAGDILLQREIPITYDDNSKSVRVKCAFTAKELVSTLLDRLERGEIIPRKQDEALASYYPPIDGDDLMVDWSRPAVFIHNQIRALAPMFELYTQHRNKFLVIRSSRLVGLEKPSKIPGTIIKKASKQLLVATGDRNWAILIDTISARGVKAGDRLL